MRSFSISLLAVLSIAGTASAAAVTRGPALQSIDQDSAIVGFRLDASCAVNVRYGPGLSLSQTATAPAGTNHFVTLEGLKPGTDYSYAIDACGQGTGKTGSFRTAPVTGSRSVHFAAMGDFGTGGSDQTKNANAIVAQKPEFWVALGDNAYASGTDEEFQTRFFDPMAPLLANVPVFPSLGNHEYETQSGQPYLDNLELPRNNPGGTERYYSFDWGNVHLVALDSNAALEEQKTWLAQDLAQSKADWKVVFFHHPPYSSGDHQSSMAMRKFAPLFEAGGVDLVLTGHDHNYERTHSLKGDQVVPAGTPGSVVYLVVGTGGAVPRPFKVAQPEWSAARNDGVLGYLDVKIDGGTLIAQLLSTTGQVADSFQLTKTLPPPTVKIVGEPATGLSAMFTAIADPADAEIVWNFGDGSAAQHGPTVTHEFSQPGRYTVTATATSGGQAGTAIAEVELGEQGATVTPSEPAAPGAPAEASPGPDGGAPEAGCTAAGAATLASPLAVFGGLLALSLARRRRRGAGFDA